MFSIGKRQKSPKIVQNRRKLLHPYCFQLENVKNHQKSPKIVQNRRKVLSPYCFPQENFKKSQKIIQNRRKVLNHWISMTSINFPRRQVMIARSIRCFWSVTSVFRRLKLFFTFSSRFRALLMFLWNFVNVGLRTICNAPRRDLKIKKCLSSII